MELYNRGSGGGSKHQNAFYRLQDTHTQHGSPFALLFD